MQDRAQRRFDRTAKCTIRLIFAFGLGLTFSHSFSSTAWAAYTGTPSWEVPDALPWTLLAIVSAVVLHALRCWRPVVYGLIEIITAVFIIYFSISPAKQSVSTVCNGKALWGLGCSFQSLLLTLAGIYVLVRGLDNTQARRLLGFVHTWRRKLHPLTPSLSAPSDIRPVEQIAIGQPQPLPPPLAAPSTSAEFLLASGILLALALIIWRVIWRETRPLE
jgi:hypothetical protein